MVNRRKSKAPEMTVLSETVGATVTQPFLPPPPELAAIEPEEDPRELDAEEKPQEVPEVVVIVSGVIAALGDLGTRLASAQPPGRVETIEALTGLGREVRSLLDHVSELFAERDREREALVAKIEELEAGADSEAPKIAPAVMDDIVAHVDILARWGYMGGARVEALLDKLGPAVLERVHTATANERAKPTFPLPATVREKLRIVADRVAFMTRDELIEQVRELAELEGVNPPAPGAPAGTIGFAAGVVTPVPVSPPDKCQTCWGELGPSDTDSVCGSCAREAASKSRRRLAPEKVQAAPVPTAPAVSRADAMSDF